MEHLKIFTEWAQRGQGQIKSSKQLAFFRAKLSAAVKAHQLPYEQHSSYTVTFYLDDGDPFTSQNFVAVSIGGIGLGSMRVTLGTQVGTWENGRYVMA